MDKPRPGGQSPSPKSTQGVGEAKHFLGILLPLLASRKLLEGREGFVKSSLNPKGILSSEGQGLVEIPSLKRLLELCSWLLASVGQSFHVFQLGLSLLGWVRRGEPCPASGNSLFYLPTDGKGSTQQTSTGFPLQCRALLALGGTVGNGAALDSALAESKDTAQAPQQNHSELSVSPTSPWSLISYKRRNTGLDMTGV